MLNRVSAINNTLGGTTTRNYSYVYDNASRITSITEPRGSVGTSYSYRNEVTGITEPTGSPFAGQSFSYDNGFNRASWTLGSSTTNYTVNNLNQYATISGTTAPTWNTDGGLATYSGNTYTYDQLGRLKEVDNSIGKYLFSYDPLGRRIKKVSENPSGAVLATSSYHYDNSEVAVEYQPSTTWTYYGNVLRTDGTNKQWYYRDGQGSVSAVTDNTGSLLEQYEYNTQGQFQIRNASGTVLTGTAIGNSLLYTNQRYDAETGNYYDHSRYYNPTLGRFISRDPLSGAEFSQGTNLYAYCGNNYANETDPSGLAYIGEYGPTSWLFGAYRWIPDGPSAQVSNNGPQRLGSVTFSPGFAAPSTSKMSRRAQFWWGVGWLAAGALDLRILTVTVLLPPPFDLLAGIIVIGTALPAIYYGLANMYAGTLSNSSENNNLADELLGPYMTPTELYGPETAPETMRP